MKFKSEDFCFDMEDHDAGLKYLAHVASHMANARLEQMLAEAPVVFNQKIGELKQENAALREALKRLLSEAEQMHLALLKVKNGPGNFLVGWRKTWVHDFVSDFLGLLFPQGKQDSFTQARNILSIGAALGEKTNG